MGFTLKKAVKGVAKGFNKAKEAVKKRNILSREKKKRSLDAKSEAKKLNSLVFLDNEDIVSLMNRKGYNVTMSSFYYVLYSISEGVKGYNVINISDFLNSGNILFIPSNFRDNIELVNDKGEILISFTPGVGSQELVLTASSNVVGIRRSDKLNEGK